MTGKTHWGKVWVIWVCFVLGWTHQSQWCLEEHGLCQTGSEGADGGSLVSTWDTKGLRVWWCERGVKNHFVEVKLEHARWGSLVEFRPHFRLCRTNNGTNVTKGLKDLQTKFMTKVQLPYITLQMTPTPVSIKVPIIKPHLLETLNSYSGVNI